VACAGDGDDFTFAGCRVGERGNEEVSEEEVTEVVGCELDFVAG